MSNTDITLRAFTRSDRERCLALFDGNVPAYFHSTERSEFETFLDAPTGPYWVIDTPRGIAGCGGWARNLADSNCAVLCWGIIDRRSHGSGLGSFLLQARIDRIRKQGFLALELNTSQHVQGFFSKFGFVEQERVADGYGPGVDRIAMRLALSNDPCRSTAGLEQGR